MKKLIVFCIYFVENVANQVQHCVRIGEKMEKRWLEALWNVLYVFCTQCDGMVNHILTPRNVRYKYSELDREYQ